MFIYLCIHIPSFLGVHIDNRKISSMISSDILSAPFSFLLLRSPQRVCSSLWWCSTSILGSVYFSSVFFFFNFLLLRLINYHCCIFKITDFFFLPTQIYLRIPLMNFSIWLIVLLTSKISFWFIFIFFSFYWYLFTHYLFIYLLCPHLTLVLWTAYKTWLKIFVH